MNHDKRVLIFGATGNIGGAAARELLRRGWQVRAVTRNPQGEEAQALASLGADAVRADMDDRASVEAAFAGMDRVFSVQNWVTSGSDGEVRQGKLVADVAKAAAIKHLVYGSAGTGEPGTGVPHFESKVVVERYMRELGLPVTSIRPTPFMELMNQREFYPPMVAWSAMPKVVGWDRPIPWVAVHDIGLAVANAFDAPERWIGRDINLQGDVRSLAECRTLFNSVMGKRPFGLPMPLGLFRKVAGDEFVQMWQWMVDRIDRYGVERLGGDVEASREVCPDLLTVGRWLKMQANGHNGR